MTIKERSVLLREAFPDATLKKLSRIVGCSLSMFYYHTDGRARRYNRSYQRNRIQQAKRKIIPLFGGKCEKCGYDRCWAALDFHHRDPQQKIMGVSNLLQGSFKKAVEEAKKCVLLCSNCHREHHAEKENDLSSVQTGDTLGVKVGMGVQSMPT